MLCPLPVVETFKDKMDQNDERLFTPESPEIDLIKEALLLLRSSPPEVNNSHNSAIVFSSMAELNSSIRHVVSPILVQQAEVQSGEYDTRTLRKTCDQIEKIDDESNTIFPVVDSKYHDNVNLKSTINIVIRNLQEDKTNPMKFIAFLLSWQLNIPSVVLLDEVLRPLQQEMLNKGEICFTEFQKYMKALSKLEELTKISNDDTVITDTDFNQTNKLFSEKRVKIKGLVNGVSAQLNANNWEGKDMIDDKLTIKLIH